MSDDLPVKETSGVSSPDVLVAIGAFLPTLVLVLLRDLPFSLGPWLMPLLGAIAGFARPSRATLVGGIAACFVGWWFVTAGYSSEGNEGFGITLIFGSLWAGLFGFGWAVGRTAHGTHVYRGATRLAEGSGRPRYRTKARRKRLQ